MTKIWIESAECSIPKKGTQEKRRTLRDELRKSNPPLAAKVESLPWYLDPDGPCGSDGFAQFEWEWTGENQIMKGWNSYLPLDVLPEMKEVALGKVRQHSLNDMGVDGCIDYSFDLKASYAFAVLKNAGVIPADSVLMNENDQPLSCDGEELEAA